MLLWGPWISEWYHTRLWSSVQCAMPWAWVWALVTTNSFSDPSTTSLLSWWFYLVYLIWYYYLSGKFVMWIVKQKIENKLNLFKKTKELDRCCGGQVERTRQTLWWSSGQLTGLLLRRSEFESCRHQKQNELNWKFQKVRQRTCSNHLVPGCKRRWSACRDRCRRRGSRLKHVRTGKCCSI